MRMRKALSKQVLKYYVKSSQLLDSIENGLVTSEVLSNRIKAPDKAQFRTQKSNKSKSKMMGKVLLLVLATVLLCSAFVTAQVKPSAEIGRVTVQVPLLSNGKPVMTQDKDKVEVAHVVELKPGKVVGEEVLVPPTVKVPPAKVRNMRAIVETVNPGVPNHGIPNPGVPNHVIPNPGVENDGLPNSGVPNHGIPKPGVPNVGIPNPGIPHPGNPNTSTQSATSEVEPVVVAPPSTTHTPDVSTKRMPSKNCHQLLLAGTTGPSVAVPVPPTPVENCDRLCTKFELNPICAHNGICIHEFPNQCIMDTFNCKHRDLSFRAVDEDVCRMGLCARRCKEEDLKM
ncbi:titin [Drosophila montana]|uniref:titin n=1 Tax=Drosophila montana TaxID=40370 RepID=UPI00313AEE4A